MTKQNIIVSTHRYILREINEGDVENVLALTTDPDWLRYIGDRGVHDQASALAYIHDRFLASYDGLGFGNWAIIDKETQAFLGVCGLLQRASMTFPELGYALLPEHRGQGIVQAVIPEVLKWAKLRNMNELFALTTPDNDASIHILKKVGFTFSRMHVEEGVSLNVYQLKL